MEESPSWKDTSRTASQKFSAFYRNCTLIIIFTRERYWSVSWARCI